MMILAADLHLRRTRPRARKDDYHAAMERKFRFTLELAQKSPPLLIAGDFFEVPKPGEAMLRWVIDLLTEYGVFPFVVPGQHDLPGHSLELLHESGLGVLAAAGVVELLTDGKPYWLPDHHEIANPYVPAKVTPYNIYIHGYPYGTIPDTTVVGLPGVLLWHHMVINQPLWPGQVADKAESILTKYPQFDLIVTGDNHQSFIIAQRCMPDVTHFPKDSRDTNFRYLVNPGSMMRSTSAQVDHKPCVYRYEDGSVQAIFLPIEEDVWDMDVVEHDKVKDIRIQACVDKLAGYDLAEMGLSFIDNLNLLLKSQQVGKETERLLWSCVPDREGK